MQRISPWQSSLIVAGLSLWRYYGVGQADVRGQLHGLFLRRLELEDAFFELLFGGAALCARAHSKRTLDQRSKEKPWQLETVMTFPYKQPRKTANDVCMHEKCRQAGRRALTIGRGTR